jgi:hypothetical protein
MTNGILVFEGMTVGILPGDLTISLEADRLAASGNYAAFFHGSCVKGKRPM